MTQTLYRVEINHGQGWLAVEYLATKRQAVVMLKEWREDMPDLPRRITGPHRDQEEC